MSRTQEERRFAARMLQILRPNRVRRGKVRKTRRKIAASDPDNPTKLSVAVGRLIDDFQDLLAA